VRAVDALLAAPALQVPLAVVDLEMTGLSPRDDRVCEVAVVRWRGGVVDEWSTLVRPGVRMSATASRCHGLSDHDVAAAPLFSEVADELTERLHGCVFVAHNAPFDLGFLGREYAACGRSLPGLLPLDTLLMARRLFAFPRNDLASACARLGVVPDGAHRALADARATLALYRAMMAILDPAGTVTVAELNELLGALAPDSPLRLAQKQTLRRAFRQRQTVWIDYQSTSHPTDGLVHREVAVWMLNLPRLQGWCHLRDGERVFRLDRCRAVKAGEREYDIPEDFEPRI
jgi:DNA polymerase III epsilon subunit family exonuclease